MMRFYLSLCLVPLIQSMGFAGDDAQRILSVSPDRRYAMKILYEGDGEPEERIESTLIHKMQLVTNPGGKFVARLLAQNDVETNFTWFPLLWSADSQWFVFYTEGPRVGLPKVFRRSGDKFLLVNRSTSLEIDVLHRVPGATSLRNVFVKPLRWLRPGTLATDQTFVLRMEDGETSDARFEVTSGYNEKTNRFRALSTMAKKPE